MRRTLPGLVADIHTERTNYRAGQEHPGDPTARAGSGTGRRTSAARIAGSVAEEYEGVNEPSRYRAATKGGRRCRLGGDHLRSYAGTRTTTRDLTRSEDILGDVLDRLSTGFGAQNWYLIGTLATVHNPESPMNTGPER